MQFLRSSTKIARLILAWFLLTLGVAIASPIVHPQSMQIICSTVSGAQMLVVDDNGEQATGSHHSLDCPLCLSIITPPAVDIQVTAQAQPLGRAVQPIVAARLAAIVGAPLPPRGPPASV